MNSLVQKASDTKRVTLFGHETTVKAYIACEKIQYRSKVSYHLAPRFLRDANRIARYAIPVARDAIRVARE